MAVKKLFDRIALIIIDQLRADYGQYFPKCHNLLKYHAVCDTKSIPTSTEAMHTNISTGKYPKDHGFISKHPKEIDGLTELTEKYKSGALTPLSTAGWTYGYTTFCLGGKFEVVYAMALPKECALMIFSENKSIPGFKLEYDKKGNPFWIEIFETWKNRNKHLDKIEDYTKFDKQLISLFEEVYYKCTEAKGLFFNMLTLPSIDLLGHKTGPCSTEIVNHLGFLDEKLAHIIKTNPSDLFILAGDHGCRTTTKYFIGEREKRPFLAHAYAQEGDLYKYLASIELDSSNASNIQHICYDGGKLSIWLNTNCFLSEQDTILLAEQGKIIDLRTNNLDSDFLEIIENSKHRNLGDILVIPHEQSTFCKWNWIDVLVRSKILQNQSLKLGELPIGEHGTYYLKDRHTLFMSNYDFGDSLANKQIREELEKLMK